MVAFKSWVYNFKDILIERKISSQDIFDLFQASQGEMKRIIWFGVLLKLIEKWESES